MTVRTTFGLVPPYSVAIGELRDLGLDLDMLGFDDEELQKLPGETGNPVATDPDDIPEPPDNPINKPRDLWPV